jgi:hypothetical protein
MTTRQVATPLLALLFAGAFAAAPAAAQTADGRYSSNWGTPPS